MKYCDCGRRAVMLARFYDMTEHMFTEQEKYICRSTLVEWAFMIQSGMIVVTRLEAIK